MKTPKRLRSALVVVYLLKSAKFLEKWRHKDEKDGFLWMDGKRVKKDNPDELE